MGKAKISAAIALDGEKEFRSAITSINKETTNLKSQMNLLKETFSGQANSLDALKARHEVLTRALQTQKDKASAIKNQLTETTGAYKRIGSELPTLKSKLEQATKKLEEMTKAGTASKEEMDAQKKEVQELANQVKIGERNYETAGKRIQKYETDLNNAEAQVIKANRELENNASHMREAETATDKCAKSIDEYGREVNQAEEKTTTFGQVLKANLTSQVIIAGVRSLIGVLRDGSEAILDLATDAAAYADEILTTSTVTRISTDSLQAYNYAAELVDVSMETLTKSMSKNVKSMYNAQKGTEDYVNAYNTLGVSVDDGNGNLRDSEQVYWDCIDALGRMTNETERDTVAMQLFGKSAQELNPLIAQGSSGIKALSDEAMNMGAVLDNEALQALGRTDDSLQRLYQSADIFKRKVGAEMAPAIEDAATEITAALADMDDEAAELASGALDAAISLFKWILENHKPITGGLKGIAAALVMYKAVSAVTDVVNALKTLKKTTDAAATATAALNTVTSLNPYALLAAGIAAVVTGLVLFADAERDASDNLKENRKAVEDCKSEYEEYAESIKASRDAHNENLSGIESEYGACEILAEKLSALSEKENKSASDKALMATYVDQLNEKIPGLNLQIDETTGSLNKETDAIEATIEAMKRKAEFEVYQDRLTELAKESVELSEKKAKAEETERAAKEKLAETEKKYADTAKKANDDRQKSYAEKNSSERAGANTTSVYAASQGKLNAELSEAQRLFEEASNTSKQYEDDLKKNGDATKEVENKIRGYSNTVMSESEAAAQAAEQSSEAQQKALESLRQKYEEIRSSIQQSIDNKINLFDAFDGGADIGADEMLSNITGQLEGLQNWEQNMRTLASHLGEEIGPELFQKFTELGPEYANAVQNMVDALNNGSAGVLEQLSQKYAETLDFSDEASRSMANVTTVVKNAMGQLSNTNPADFDKLKTAFDGVEKSAKDAFNSAVESAKASGAEIPDGLAEGIENGEISVESATGQLNASVQARFDFLNGLAQDAGISIPQEIADGVAAGGDKAAGAFEQLASLFSAKSEDLKNAGTEAGENTGVGYAEGIECTSATVEAAGEAVSKAGSEAINSHCGLYENVGRTLIGLVAYGMNQSFGTTNQSAASMVSSAASTASFNASSFQNVGYNMAAGVAVGIRNGQNQAVNAAVNMVRAAKEAANKENKVNSPSKVFRDQVGMPIPEGTALGITNGIVLVKKSASNMAKAALNSTEPNKITKSWKNWVGKRMADGVAFGINEGTGKAKKTASELANAVLSAAEKQLDGKRTYTNMTVKEEIYMWDRLIKDAKKKGGQYYKLVKSSADAAKKELEKSNKDYGLSGSGLDMYKTYYNVSAKAEVQYWDTVRRKFKKGTADRIEADQKYYEAKNSLNEQLKELNENYAENVKDTNDQLKEDIQSLTDDYKSAVSERKSAIMSSVGLLEEFYSESESGDKLLYNLRTQVAGIADWEKQLETLKSKGISAALLEELQSMGPEASASIHALNSLTSAQLKEYNSLYAQKQALAESQAVKENETLRKQTEAQAKKLTAQAQAQINAYKKEYDSAVNELNKAIQKPLKKLADQATTLGENATAKLIAGIKKGATKKSTAAELKKVSNQVANGLSSLPQAGKTIGTNTLQGILNGLLDGKKIKGGAKDFVNDLTKQIKKAAGIRSPSKLFEDEVGVQIPAGVGVGIKKNTQKAATAGTDMIHQMLAQSQAQLQRQKLTLSEYASSINAAGSIEALNSLVSTPAMQQPQIRVDNSQMSSMFEQVVMMMQEYFPQMANQQLVLDTGQVVGGTGEQMRQNFALAQRRIR